MRGKLGDSFKTSSDAAVLRFGLAFQDADAVVMDLKSATLVRSPKGEDPQGLTAPNLVGLPITDWQDSTAPKFKGVKIPIGSGESSRVLAVRNDRSGFALGLDYSLRAFDSRGRQIWTRTVPGVSWGITLSEDGEVIVATHGDGTVRWYRWSDGRELLALFVDAPTLKWVAWTPTGYYMASPGGEDLVGWHLNRGWNQLADFFPASRFSARFNRPDIVQSILNTKDELIAVRNSDSVARRATVKTSVAATLPPIVAISGVSGGTSFTGDSVEIAYSLRSPSGASIDGVEALVDGRPLESRGLARIDAAPKEAGARKIVVPLPPHDVEVSLIARSGTMVGEAATIKLTYAGGVERTADVLKPKLYAVAIGVSDYANSELKLTYPSEDAKAFAEALAKQKGGIYGDVEVKVLVDRQVTRAAVISALKWLGKSTTSRDVAMVMFAGHGHNDDQNNYWFLPGDADVKDIEATAISQDDIMRQLRGVYGKTMLFLDTCHANQAVAAAGVSKRGFVDVNGFVSELAKAENGLIVFSSSQGRELSSESSQWKHGAFTLALLEGLAGKADLLHHGAITVSELDVYVAERVKTLTNGAQHPVMSRPNTVQDFPFAVPK